VNLEEKIVVQKLLQGAESEIQLLRKNLKFPAIEHVLAPKVAQI